jgi:hypothetical protein
MGVVAFASCATYGKTQICGYGSRLKAGTTPVLWLHFTLGGTPKIGNLQA